MSEAASKVNQGSQVQASSPQSRGTRWQNLAHRGIAVLWVSAGLGQIYLWTLFAHPMENAIRNMVTLSMGLLLTILTLAWWLLFAPFSRKARWLVASPVLLAIAALIGSVRGVDNSADLSPRLRFRWEETGDQKLARYQASAKKVQSEIPGDLPVEITAEDMPAFRGLQRDGIVVGPQIIQDFDSNPPRELWRHPCGGGYSSLAIVGRRVVTLEQRGNDEAIVCYDLETGHQLWEHHYAAHFQEPAGGPGPRSTPTIDAGAVFTVGALGDVYCVDLSTGAVRWQDNMLRSFGIPNTDWAMTSSPLVVDNMLIVNPGGISGNGLIAYDKADGQVLWTGAGISHAKTTGRAEPVAEAGSAVNTTSESEGHASQAGRSVPGYCAPMLVTLCGVRQILNFDGKGLRGHVPATGEELWFFPAENAPHVNSAQPIVLEGNRVFLSASYGSGAKMLQVSQSNGTWEVQQLWANQNLRSKFSSCVYLGGFIYGLDEGIMVCVDPATGERKWKGGKTPLRGRYNHGQMLATDGRIVLATEQGELVLIEPSPEKLIERGHVLALPGLKMWNPLAMSRGRAVLRHAEEIVCYDLRLQPQPATLESSTATVVQ